MHLLQQELADHRLAYETRYKNTFNRRYHASVLRADSLTQDVETAELRARKAVQIVIKSINDPPSIVSPTTLLAREDTPIVVADVRVEDPDCDETPRGMLEVQIAAQHGNVQFVGPMAGLYLMEALPGQLKIRGKTTPVNVALAGLTYQGAPEFSGHDTVVIGINDLGNTGVGGPLQANTSISVSVEPVNDPPELWGPPDSTSFGRGVMFVMEDETTPIGKIGVSDPDNTLLRINVSATIGTVDVRGRNDHTLPVVASTHNLGTGAGSSITFEGTVEGVNAVLARMTYTSAPNWNSVANGRDMIKVRPNKILQVRSGSLERLRASCFTP